MPNHLIMIELQLDAPSFKSYIIQGLGSIHIEILIENE